MPIAYNYKDVEQGFFELGGINEYQLESQEVDIIIDLLHSKGYELCIVEIILN